MLPYTLQGPKQDLHELKGSEACVEPPGGATQEIKQMLGSASMIQTQKDIQAHAVVKTVCFSLRTEGQGTGQE